MAATVIVTTDGRRPPYSSYIGKVYKDGVFNKQLPCISTNPKLLEQHAKESMPPQGFGYIHGGAGELSTMDANRLAFRQWKIIPRVFRQSSPRDLRVEVFGVKYDCPIFMAPIGVQGLFHPEREIGLAEACAKLGVPYTLSTAATSTIEEVGSVCGSHPHWYQLYWPQDDAITASLLRRAKAAGFSTLVVTLDTPTVGWRPEDLDTGNMPFLRGTSNAVGFSDPVFRAKFAEMSGGSTPEEEPIQASSYWIGEVFAGIHHSWEDLDLLRRHWEGPIVLKGVQSVEDAGFALGKGVDGIVVSNHGGRQVDGAVASLDMLPDIVEAVGNEMTVLFDSGIRTGTDILKALALGARAVFVGRPAVYGLGIAGKEGAQAVMAGLLGELDQTMGIAGLRSIDELKPGILKQVNYGGDVKSVP